MPTRHLAPRLALMAALALLPLSGAAQSAGTPLPPLKVIDTGHLDRATSACTDFFQFANGSWLARDTIPPEYAWTGVVKDMVDRNELVVRGVLEDLAGRRATLPAGGTERKVGIFYGTCMDSVAAERAGFDPIRPLLREVEAIRTRADLVREIAALQAQGADVLFRYDPAPDPHDATHYMAWFSQGGLGMPDRDYYTDRGEAADSVRRAYLEHVARYLTMVGRSEAAARRDATQVMALETALARASLTRVELRSPEATDHPTPFARFRTIAPHMDWSAYLRAIGFTSALTTVNVAEPAFFARMDSLLATTPLDAWRAYLAFHVVALAAPALSSAFVQEDFAFESRFTGATVPLPRWRRCLLRTDRLMGEAMGAAYVAATFPPAAKARASSIIRDIRAAFGERVKRIGWMSEPTKKAALDKLARMGQKVGYPDRWRDYGRLELVEGPHVLNSLRATRFEWERTVGRPGMAVDTAEWGITVPTVNAYYDPSRNEMVYPAGTLVPQTFDLAADDAANYGALGASWAGHELTHGFDDEGRQYDAVGNLRDWWTPQDSVHFNQQAALIIEQFNGYVQVDTIHVNGRLTAGENIADFGGLLTGFDALQRALERNGRPGPIDGFTPEQRFFLAYAQTYRGHVRPEQLRSWAKTDPHSPERLRVNGPLGNFPEFAKAFACKPGDPMVRPVASVPEIW
ncbi:MAG TPA: M13 family metallopeptidase [Gemmatimonadales bacterium]|nr:M13 family metallopeptidase [Gemmatimonadales bacterium]